MNTTEMINTCATVVLATVAVCQMVLTIAMVCLTACQVFARRTGR